MKHLFTKILGLSLIVVAFIFLLRAAGLLPAEWSKMLISWQALVSLIGLLQIAHRRYFSGLLILLVGGYFLMDRARDVFGVDVFGIDIYTTKQISIAIALLIIGIAVIVGPKIYMKRINRSCFADFTTPLDDGAIDIKAVFGGVEHIVVEKPFKGARILSSFAGVKLDLRNTTLPEGETVIELKCAFAGVEIIVPSDWSVSTKAQPVFGGIEDKRERNSPVANAPKRLLITGNVVFGGVELKNGYEGDFSAQQPVNECDSEEEGVTNNETIESISVKHNNKVHIIPLDELQYILADGDYVTICSTQGKFLKEQTMKYFQTSLPLDRFIRIHRSCIVKLSEISYVDTKGRESYFVVLKDGTSLRASSTGYQLLKQRLAI